MFNFFSRLHSWARAKLRMRAIQDISFTLVVVEGLVDYKYISSFDPTGDEKKRSNWKKGKASSSNDG